MMIEERFKDWLSDNTNYTKNVVKDIVSRVKRADNILEIGKSERVYFFEIEECSSYQNLSPTIKSQLKKAIRLYYQYINEERT